jgi:hypothetical protein
LGDDFIHQQCNAIANNTRWDKVKTYDSLIGEIRKGTHRVSKNDLVRSVKKLIFLFFNKTYLVMKRCNAKSGIHFESPDNNSTF